MAEAGFPEELHPACQAGRCRAPISEGGLGVIDLHPVNGLVYRFYGRCRTLSPSVAAALTDLSWHPDRDLCARQLEVLVRAFGPLGDPPPTCPRESERAGRVVDCGHHLVLVEAQWRCPACGWPGGR
jgi:hypothetical protein